MPRRDRLTVGIDVGTSSCKSTVVTTSGHVIAESGRPYPTRRTAAGEVSQDPADWLRAVRATLSSSLRDVDASTVEAIGVTAPAHYAVLLDGERRPLGRVLLSSDGRPAATAERLRASIGDRFFAVTNVALTAGWTLPQVRWLFDTDASLSQRVSKVLIAKDWVRAELTGEDATDPSDAAGTGMYDQAAQAWSEELLAVAGLRTEQVPPIRAATAIGGHLRPAWARRVGLPSGIPVAIGATDTAAELVSVGALDPGGAVVKIASTGTVVVLADAPRPDPRLMTYPSALPGRWYGITATSTAVTSDVWLRDSLLGGTPASEGFDRDIARSLAARVRPGSDGLLFLPFLEGERSPYWDASLRGAFLGLSSAHGRAHLCRAVLEGVAFSLRDGRDTLAEAGLACHEPVLTGGGLRSRLWQRIVVDVLGQAARTIEVQGPSIGAALLAAEAAGFGSLTSRSPGARPKGRLLRPDPDRARVYDKLFRIYRDAVSATTEVSHRLVSTTSSD